MRASRPISLFTERPPAHNRPSAFVVSVFVHCGVVFMVVFGFLYAPRINMDAAAERYVVRQIDIDPLEAPPMKKASGSGADYPTSHAATHTASAHSKLAAPSSSVRRLHLKLAKETLVEPNTPANMVLKQIPVPSMLLWSEPQPNVTLIRPPQFKKPMLNDLRASVAPPNAATHVADMAITPTPFSSPLPMPIPSTTTPILVHAPNPTDAVPETASMTTANPSTMAVMSISNFNMTKGAFALPPANQTANGVNDGGMAPGHKGQSSLAGSGDASSRDTGASRGDGLGNADEVADARSAGAKNGSGHSAGKGRGPGSGSSHGASPATLSGPGLGSDDGPDVTLTRLNLPEDGQYGVVVVGSSIQQQYPETAGLWGGRLVYSVFLHVGLARNWILQFTLPSSSDPNGVSKVKQIQAPWPYFILRPNVDADYVNSNAMMIHGYINDKGRFEHLMLVVPPRYAHAQQLLDALKQWQFRPASQRGMPARVEVLLIMPEGNL
ncbi:MAG TPA: hypothetical protein VND90_04810 [Terracidiphilus sp.]|nr:hypothetical protein [Terracidiphilus sp.]